MIQHIVVPTFVLYCIIAALITSMTFALHCITSNRASRSPAVTSASVDRVSRVTKVIATSECTIRRAANVVSWWCRQAKSRSWHGITWRSKSKDRNTISQPQQTGNCSTQAMSSEQDISIRIESCDIMVEILGGVVVTIFVAEILHQARRVAGICSRLAVTDL